MAGKGNREILIQVATLYYQGRMSQDEIASIMNVSRTKVSRMLKQCRDMRIVEFKINTSAANLEKLEEKLTAALGVRKVYVVPSASNPDDSKRNVGRRAAQFIQENLKRGMDIGVAWGSTIMAAINEFSTKQFYEDIRVVQLSGGINLNAIDYDAKDIVRKFSEKLHADAYYFQAPLVVQSKLLKDLLQKEPEIKNTFELFNRLDLAIIGIGSTNPNDCMVYRAGYISLDESETLIKADALGDVCGHRITPEGKPASNFLEGRVLAIDLQVLKKVPTVVAVASGNEKTESIKAAAKGGYFDILIIDDLAAISLDHSINSESEYHEGYCSDGLDSDM